MITDTDRLAAMAHDPDEALALMDYSNPTIYRQYGRVTEGAREYFLDADLDALMRDSEATGV